jgi:hypothetical protein
VTFTRGLGGSRDPSWKTSVNFVLKVSVRFVKKFSRPTAQMKNAGGRGDVVSVSSKGGVREGQRPSLERARDARFSFGEGGSVAIAGKPVHGVPEAHFERI